VRALLTSIPTCSASDHIDAVIDTMLLVKWEEATE